jgi:hypothetical protein
VEDSHFRKTADCLGKVYSLICYEVWFAVAGVLLTCNFLPVDLSIGLIARSVTIDQFGPEPLG